MLCKIKRSIFFNNNSFYSYGILPLQSLFVSIGSFNDLNNLMQSMRGLTVRIHILRLN